MRRRQGEPDARPHVDGLPPGQVAGFEHAGDPPRRGLDIAGTGKEERELITSEPRDARGILQRAEQPVADLHEDFVARSIAERVVDAPESIEPNDKEMDCRRALGGLGHRLLQSLDQPDPVWQTGQGVLVGKAENPILPVPDAFPEVVQTVGNGTKVARSHAFSDEGRIVVAAGDTAHGDQQLLQRPGNTARDDDTDHGQQGESRQAENQQQISHFDEIPECRNQRALDHADQGTGPRLIEVYNGALVGPVLQIGGPQALADVAIGTQNGDITIRSPIGGREDSRSRRGIGDKRDVEARQMLQVLRHRLVQREEEDDPADDDR